MNERRLAMTKFVNDLCRVVNAAYPTINWARETPETIKAEDALDFYLGTYFYGEFDPPSVTIDQVREAFRTYYKLHIPGQQELL